MRWRVALLCTAVGLTFAGLTSVLGPPASGQVLPAGPATPDEVVGPLASLAAWVVAARLAVGALVTAAALATDHRWWHRAAVVAAPGWLRRLVVTAVGAGLLSTGLMSPTAATAGSGTTEASSTWTADRPSDEPLRDPRVVVARGDSLWSIAEDRLGPRSTARDVAASWPRWYAANRARIGTDPHLIRPGQRLRPPPG